MTEACSCDLETGFDAEVAARDLAAYRRDGLPLDQRRLLAAIVAAGVEDRTVLDVGGGVGAIHHELLSAGARSVTDVDGSTAYLNVARDEARRRGDLDRISYRHGDFVQLAEDVEPADVVLLLRVLCCYPDMPSLVQASARRARRSYGLIYPRSTWWMRAAAAIYYALRPVVGPSVGPGYVRAEHEVDTAVRREGFEVVAHDSTWLWRIALYERVAGVPGQGR
jgi:magnesium-protoporphyrin O-methyltransferase